MDKDDIEESTELYEKLKEGYEILDAYVDKFYSIKNDYETKRNIQKEQIKQKMSGKSNKRIRKALEEQKYTCVNCSRKVGMFFSTKDNKLIAKCGSEESPCNLKIIINKGTYYSYEKMIHGTMDVQGLLNEINEFKLNIIRMKLDMIFDFSNVRDTLKEFNRIKEDLNELYDILREREAIYLDTTDKYDYTDLSKLERQKEEIINSIKRMISHYDNKSDVEKQELNREQIFAKISDKYVNDLDEIIKKINNMKYNVYEVYRKNDNDTNKKEEKDNDKYKCINLFLKREYTYVDTVQQHEDYAIESFIHATSEQNKIE
jgi:hypothetical protein